jgi:hypothetical protein
VKVVHCKVEPFDVYIGRPSMWGNEYSHKEDTIAKYKAVDRDHAIELFEIFWRVQLSLDREFVIEWLKPLVGKTLGCWCAPKPCHGEVLIKFCRELGLIE